MLGSNKNHLRVNIHFIVRLVTMVLVSFGKNRAKVVHENEEAQLHIGERRIKRSDFSAECYRFFGNREYNYDEVYGYPPIKKNDIRLQLTKERKAGQFAARISWNPPNGTNKEPLDVYWLIWSNDDSVEPKNTCVELNNTTNVHEITGLTITNKDWVLELYIEPWPTSSKEEVPLLQIRPSTEASSEPNEMLFNQTTLLPSEVSATSKGIPLIAKTISQYLQSRTQTIHGKGDDSKDGDAVVKLVALSVGGVLLASIFLAITVFYFRKKKSRPPPDVPDERSYFYVSYCPESECHIGKVVDFTLWFRHQGYDVQMDIMQTPHNEKQLRELGRFRFGERQLGKAKNIFMILSASYLKLCRLDEADEPNVQTLSQEERIVYSEITQMRDELCSTAYRNRRFIPVLFGVKDTELPFWIKGLVVYSWPDDKLNNRLLYRLNEQVEYSVGEIPEEITL